MANTVNTDERIFQVHFDHTHRAKICNLEDLEEIITKAMSVKKIEHLWNFQFRKISKKDLKDLLQSENLNTDFLKLV